MAGKWTKNIRSAASGGGLDPHLSPADDSMQDLFHNIPGSRDVAVKRKDGGLGGRAVFVARHDLRPAK